MTSSSDPELNTKRQSARKGVTQSYRGLILKPASCNELDLRVCCSGNENGPFLFFTRQMGAERRIRVSNTSNTPTSNLAAIGKRMVRETLESGITPLTFDYQNVVYFGKETGILRTTMVLHSPDVGTLTYREFRFVARRSRPGLVMV